MAQFARHFRSAGINSSQSVARALNAPLAANCACLYRGTFLRSARSTHMCFNYGRRRAKDSASSARLTPFHTLNFRLASNHFIFRSASYLLISFHSFQFALRSLCVLCAYCRRVGVARAPIARRLSIVGELQLIHVVISALFLRYSWSGALCTRFR